MRTRAWTKQTARWIAAALALVVISGGASAVQRALGVATDETIRGTTVSDDLRGTGGDDRIFGLAGDDMIAGGYGSDRLWGGPGNDLLLARDGERDVVVCGPGRDDVALVDEFDVVSGCETLRLVSSVLP